jgi:hypothetical protein
LDFLNCTVTKELSLKYYGIQVKTLSFKSFLNYGNIIFTDIHKIDHEQNGTLEFINSDLGKTIFMNCKFKEFGVIFMSTKMNEIFLAGTDFPSIADENYRTISGIWDYEQKNLCYTQLKKVYDLRGDSMNSTRFHEAELSTWSKNLEILVKEQEKIGSTLQEKKNLTISNLEQEKLLYSQYKKLYEGRGDTVKALEFYGKELDTQREIVRKSNGQFWEKLQLFFNRYSNNFGQSWELSLAWIFFFGIIFYFSYCLSLGFKIGAGSDEDKKMFYTLASYFFEFINPIRKGEFIKLEDKENFVKITNIARFIDFVARVIFAYLIYQMVQAFRKYSKKTS